MAGGAEIFSGFAKMTKAVNGVKSTLSSDLGMIKRAATGGFNQSRNIMAGSGTAANKSARIQAELGHRASGLVKDLGAGKAMGYSAAAGGIATAGGIAAADLVNPWGLGWND